MNNLKLIKTEGETFFAGKKQNDWLSALFKINRLLHKCTSLAEVYDKVIEIVTGLLEVESAAIILFSQDTNELILERAAFALSGEELAAYRFPLTTSGKTISVFQTGLPYVSENSNQDSTTFSKYTKVFGVRNTAMVPLEIENRRIGVLHVYNKKAGLFTQEDQEILMILAAHLAVLIENVCLYEREKKMVEALDKLNQKTIAHQARLEKLLEIHNQLIAKVLRGEGLPVIVKALSALLQAPVLIEDRHCQLQGASEDMDDNKYTMKHLPGNKKKLEQKLKSGQIVRIFPYCYHGEKYTRIIAPIGDPGQLMGYLSVIMDPVRAENDLENVAIEQGAIVLALEMMKDKIHTEVEARYRGEFLDDLLTGAYGSDESFFERAKFFGYDFSLPTRVVVANLKKKGKNIISAEMHRQFIKDTVNESFPHCFTARKKNNLVILLPVTSQGTRELTAGLKRVKEKISRQYPDFNTTMGIGNVCRELSDYQESYQQAVRALAFTRPEVPGNRVIYYDELGVFGLLAEIKDPTVLSKFVTSKIGPLLVYDPKKSKPLIDTLDEYIKSGNSLKDTAETLHIHIGTLKYRLRRIREILDIIEFSAETLFELRVALCANRLLSE